MAKIKGVFGDPKARVITLRRTQKKRYAAVAVQCIEAITTRRGGTYGIFHVEMPEYIWKWKCGGSNARGVGR